MTCAELGPARKIPLPTNGNSFVACSMPKVLHAPAECAKVVIDFDLVFLPRTTISRLHTHLLRTVRANCAVECILRAKTLQLHLTGMDR